MVKYLNKFIGLTYNFIGWHTSRRIIVIESDDWGSVRTPSYNTLKTIPEKFKKHYNNPYNKFDSIASSQDLEILFEVLSQVKDIHGKNPIITANCIMANPDFDKIKKNNFTKYYYEDFATTIKTKYNRKILSTWKEGMDNNLFYPQLHGREHVNVKPWMQKLKKKDPLYLDAFERNVFSVNHDLLSNKKNFTASLDNNNKKESIARSKDIDEALNMFKDHFGYSSDSFISPSYTWDENIEFILNKNKVKYIQGIRVQKEPTYQERLYKYKNHYLGEKNKTGQRYLVRNAFFEPSINPNDFGLDKALSRVNIAFKLFQPAIISMHRLNFIGRINENNRDHNLILLKKLLSKIKHNWPNVEFMTSVELGDLILSSNFKKNSLR